MLKRTRQAALGMVCTFLVWGCRSTAQEAQRRLEFVDAHPGISEVMAQAILDEEILVGMDKTMVEASWGRPARIEVGDLEGQPMELWIYGNVWNGEPLRHLFFNDDDVLVKFEVQNPLTVSPGEVVGKANEPDRTVEHREQVKSTPR